MDKTKLDLQNDDHQLIVAGMTNLVDKGMHPWDVWKLLDDIKRATFPALMQIHRGEG